MVCSDAVRPEAENVARPQARHPRQRRRFVIRFRACGRNEEEARFGFTGDVNATGLFVQTATPFRPGTRLEIELQGEGTTVRLVGRVVWARTAPPGLGSQKRAGMGIALDGPWPDLEGLRPRTRD